MTLPVADPGRHRPASVDPGRSVSAPMEVSAMAARLEVKSRRLLTEFSANLNRLDPQPLDWQRFDDFILYAFDHEPPSAEAVGHALV